MLILKSLEHIHKLYYSSSLDTDTIPQTHAHIYSGAFIYKSY